MTRPKSPEQPAAYARLYQSLAEALAEPPAWFKEAGEDWPLFEDALAAARTEGDPVLYQIAGTLADAPPESAQQRHIRHQRLMSSFGKPNAWYESLALDGRLAGPLTFEVWSLYESVGLKVAGPELPDHVSVELAFLAFLAEQEADSESDSRRWRSARRMFARRHAGRWLPGLGRSLAASGDQVYAPLGELLAYLVQKELRPLHRPANKRRVLPELPQPETCNLCGFCVQVCPTRALAVEESDDTTALLLVPGDCIGCDRCVRTCPTHALNLAPGVPAGDRRALRESPRERCPACGQPTISMAEMEAVAERIGRPEWLKFCLNCRAVFLEESL